MTKNETAVFFQQLKNCSPGEIRSAIRRGDYSGQTSGLGLGYLQGNVAIVPSEYALDFFRFCQRNPKPCPLVGVTDGSSSLLRDLGKDVDIRSDVPAYNIYRNGDLVETKEDISDIWTDDLVAFVLGCSFSFEEALISEGIPIRHMDENKTVPMYRTNIATTAAGPFTGPLVVSMRPMSQTNAIRAINITSRFPQAHGSPVHIGDPATIGISDINSPDWGDATEIKAGEVPVFWACGVTPQAVIRSAKLPIFISHAPGHMLISDIKSWDTTRLQEPKL
ncbi:MAG: putative hydro-lyase [Sneathiella sp.]|uniref:putative hydro-lyase n=1 Tax=Sneathiella sp. TaxID=1964365 RepID=UPI0030028867